MDHACKICTTKAIRSFESKIRGKYSAEYYLCPSCGFLFIPEVPWLEEAYSKAITSSDLGLVKRNLVNKKIVSAVAYRLAGPNARILDLAGGYGLLARLLRDTGFDAWSQDDYCENLFAELFTPEEREKNFDLLTAFEVFEHLPDPAAFLEKELGKRGRHPLLFSTQTYHNSVPPPNWHYYAMETGQHIAFYTPVALATLGARFELTSFSLSDTMHLYFPREGEMESKLRIFRRRKISRWYMAWTAKRMKGRSLLPTDAIKAQEMARHEQNK